ncbi:MAG TPA: hypothetical protein VJ044_01915, partial [Candidatus Hodarchaeales archaeon]|nr:hypothetical protein [Candidatus Hodarchaeales archaeon]
IEPQTIQMLFTPKVDSSDWYTPLMPVHQFDFRTVKDWIDSPSVRLNLFQVGRLGISIFPFSNKYQQRVEIEFNSPFQLQYQNYILSNILPRYINAEPKALSEDQIESDLIKQLIRAAFGVLTITSKDVYRVFESIFPQLIIQRVADDGDCYYSSVGLINDRSPLQVRYDLAEGFAQMSPQEQATTVNMAVGECPEHLELGRLYAENRSFVIQQFPEILQTPCGQGRQDCGECLWGGNFLDEIVHLVYQLPVISIGIVSENQAARRARLADLPETERVILEFILNLLTPSFWNSRNQTLTFPVSQPTVSISIYPSLEGPAEDQLMASTRFIGYIATSGKHVDGILPRIR